MKSDIVQEKAIDSYSVKRNISSKTIAKLILLLGCASLAPVIGVQALTGTIVNASLYIAAYSLGLGAAALISIVPSSISLIVGFLPAALAPMVPFIVLSNFVLAFLFLRFSKKNFRKGVIFASLVKFSFLYLVSTFVIGYFVSEKIADKVALMMSWPQLYTALSGGILAYFVLKITRNIK